MRMTRYIAAAAALLLATLAGAATAAAQSSLVVFNVQKTANAPATLPEDETECATFLQDVQKSPKNFKIASMQVSQKDFCCPDYTITYTLDGVDGSGDPAEIILTCSQLFF